MKEIFKKVTLKGFERYSVSNYGNVRNNISGNVLSKRKASNGYLRVNLRTGTVPYEKPTVVHVHRLVAESFFFRLLRANHMLIILTETKKTMLLIILNGARRKRIVNTQYRTKADYREECKVNIVKAQNRCKKKLKMIVNGKVQCVFGSKSEAAKKLGVNEKTIYNYLHGATKPIGYELLEVM